jgi:hypothetical protein
MGEQSSGEKYHNIQATVLEREERERREGCACYLKVALEAIPGSVSAGQWRMWAAVGEVGRLKKSPTGGAHLSAR